MIYVYTGLTAGVSGQLVSDHTPAHAADWVPVSSALVARCVATAYATNALTPAVRQVERIRWENNPSLSYFGRPYLYGLQESLSVPLYSDQHGFEVEPSSTILFNLENYRAAPLLWGGSAYSPPALQATDPRGGAASLFRVSGQAGRYVHDIQTNHWPDPVTSLVDRVFIDYDPLAQRPNAITPFMGMEHLLALDQKLNELIPFYFDGRKENNDSFDEYCATAGVYWVHDYDVGPIWFEPEKITSTQEVLITHFPHTENPAKFQDTNSWLLSSSNDYQLATNDLEVAGTMDDYDHFVADPSPTGDRWPVPGWTHSIAPGFVLTNGPQPGPDIIGSPTNYDYVVTGVVEMVGGTVGTEADHNGTRWLDYLTAGAFATAHHEAVVGAGPLGEIDYYFSEVPGDASNWDRRVLTGTEQGTAGDHDWYTVTTNAGTPEAYDFFSVTTNAGTPVNHNYTTLTPHDVTNRVYIWEGVPDLLAGYMTPWLVDHIDTGAGYRSTYMFNRGWSPSYATGWRLYQQWMSTNYTTNYFILSTNFFALEYDYKKNTYDYYRNNTNDDATPWHYRREYNTWWKWPTEEIYYQHTVVTQDYYTTAPIDWWTGITTNYFKWQTRFYKRPWHLKEQRYRISYPVHPTPPPRWTVADFFAAFPNLHTPIHQTERQVLLSTQTITITNTSGSVASWQQNTFTNELVSVPAIDSSAWSGIQWAEVFNEKRAQIEQLNLVTAPAVLEFQHRQLSTTNYAAPAWSSQPISTGAAGGIYRARIEFNDHDHTPTRPATFVKTAVRARRTIPPVIYDGPIDCYLRFGSELAGRLDIEGIGYPLGPWVKVSELSIPAGQMTSAWLGDITTPPGMDGLDQLSYQHQAAFSIQNTGADPVFIFRPAFED